MSRNNSFTCDDSPHVFRTRSAVLKLLEQVRAEKPSLRVISKPSEPVVNRNSKLKFPDPKKDCFVSLKVSSQNGKLCLPINYETLDESDQKCYGGLRYILQVLSVNKLVLNGKQPRSNECQEDFCRFSPLSTHKKGSAKNCLGFWFRFFGKDAKIRITVALKIDFVFARKLIGKRLLTDPLFQDDGMVSSLEFDISTCMRSSLKIASEKNGLINAAKIFPSLYLNQEYKRIVTKFKDLRQKLNFKELDKFFAQTLERLSDNDLRVVLFLEQSQEACRKKLYEKSKQLLKQAVDSTAKCKNKTLLIGRAYLYLSYVHEKDGYLGNAEECLTIARKKLQTLEVCEDTGDLCFQEGLILTSFAQKMPKFALKLISEAMFKFEQAAAIFTNCLTVDSSLDKLCCSYIRLASLLLKQTAEGSCSQHKIDVSNKHLEWVAGRLDELSEQTKFHFYVCNTELLYQKRQFEEAQKSLDVAYQIAKACQFEEQTLWEELPGSNCCSDHYFQEASSNKEPADDLVVENFVVDDVSPGYLADMSS